MTLLTALGLASMVFTAWFTWRAYRDDSSINGEQSRRQAIIEVWIGIVIGFALNWSVNWVLLPLVGAKFTALENMYLGFIYTFVSIIRGYAIRRWADSNIHRFSAWVSSIIS